MGMGRRTQLFAAWIAGFAILLAALAPSIAHAVAARHAALAAMHEICSADSTHDASGSHHAPADPGAHMEHCPFCLTNALPLGLLAASFSLPVIDGGQAAPRLFYQSPRPLFAWAAAQPRGPPA